MQTNHIFTLCQAAQHTTPLSPPCNNTGSYEGAQLNTCVYLSKNKYKGPVSLEDRCTGSLQEHHRCTAGRDNKCYDYNRIGGEVIPAELLACMHDGTFVLLDCYSIFQLCLKMFFFNTDGSPVAAAAFVPSSVTSMLAS